MGDFVSRVVLPACIFYLIWFPASILVLRTLFNGYWNPHRRTATGVLRAALIAEPVLMALPPLFAIFVLITLHASRPRGISGWELGVGFLLLFAPQFLFNVIAGIRIGKAERRAAGDRDPANIERAQKLKIYRYHAVPLTVLLVALLSGAGIPVLLIAIAALIIVPPLITAFGRRFPEGGFEMEDTPIRKEISTIAAQFGARSRKILVRPIRNNFPLLARPMLVPLRRGAFAVDRDVSVIPLAHFLDLEPEVLTLGLARRWARFINAGSFYGTAEVGTATRSFVTVGALGCGCVAMPIAATIGLFLLSAIYSSSTLLISALGYTTPDLSGSGVLVVIYTGLVIAGVIYMMGRSLGLFPSRFEFHKNAFRAWSSTEEAGVRFLPQYAAATAKFLASTQCIYNPEVVLLQLERDRAFLRLLNTGPPGVWEQSWEAIHAALEDKTE